MARTKKSGSPIRVATTRHRDKRTNIPTEELRDFVAEDEAEPDTLLYPRDPSLDPQLVWKGKDEQDREDLAVPNVPVYIQEKIHPQAIIENVRAEAKKGQPEIQPSLFADFNGIEFEQLIEFYQHEQNWANRMILGDSLLVMASLAEKEGLKGKVQMIYIDPPYGIKFGSNWQVSTRKRDVRDSKAEDATRQPEQIKAFRDTWELGIHSYLAYLRDRLVVARELLTETGSVFVQIGDENIHLVRCLMDEVFGSENFCAQVAFKKTGASTDYLLPSGTDHMLWFAKHRELAKYRQLHKERTLGLEGTEEYIWIEEADGAVRYATPEELAGITPLAEGCRAFRPTTLTSSHHYTQGTGVYRFQGRDFSPGTRYWSTHPEGLQKCEHAGRLIARRQELAYKRYLDDFPVLPLTTAWPDTMMSSRGEQKVFVVQTSTKVVSRCVLMTTDPGDLVLDPTCGSGTTAYVAEQWGRRWITIDTSRVALALARTRLMSARYPYYLLADSPEGMRKEAEVTGQTPPDYKPVLERSEGPVLSAVEGTENDIKKGFVYKRVPHITLKSIANNPDIHDGMTREEIDDAISRHADSETLYDQPYEDSKRIRVTGPFTVESLSPHRVLATDEDRPATEREARRSATVGQFETMILENLKKAGVQNTVKDERLEFDRLEPYAGEWLHAEGEYTDKDGLSRRVAISIGPEHGTVGTDQVKEAAKEALKGAGFDLLVVCGFAFDAHAGETAKEFEPDDLPKRALERSEGPALERSEGPALERSEGPALERSEGPALERSEGKKSGSAAIAEETRQYGKLPVLLARMNPDLAMGDELLKKTGAGNLFMVFGEPDLDIAKQPDGKLVVEIKGVDVYDPTTGQIRSSSTDDIACWFIDTDYNEESFFVRHAYFTGAEEPYDRLRRALRADIDEAAWSALYSTRSYPFDPPETGKIAVKVINHYGDEVLKVYEV